MISTPEQLAYKKQYRLKIKQKMLDLYGTKCVCCGETRIEMLTIDHIDGKGDQHRRRLSTDNRTNDRGGRGGWVFYLYHLKNEPFDPNLQTMCFNCNSAKRGKPMCPHQLTRAEAKADWESMTTQEQLATLDIA